MQKTRPVEPDSMKDFISIFVKGAAMGAADIVPGVSGGTVAFILGVYERLINAICKADTDALNLVKTLNFRGLWLHFDATFLVAIFLGILTSIFTLASGVGWMLENYPEPLWSFFSGLILFSIPFFYNAVSWNIRRVCLMVGGVVFAYYIGQLSEYSVTPSLFKVFLSGMIAITAMILPGISGSFILILLGMYSPIISSIKSFDLIVLANFSFGCIVGLFISSKVIAMLMTKCRQTLIPILMGIVIGSLYLIWPWQINSKPIMWFHYADLGKESHIALCIAGVIFGVCVILTFQVIDKFLNPTETCR